MKKKVEYSAEEIAKYNAISVCGSLQEIAGIRFTAERVLSYHEAMLKDLQTGAMERSCREFDRICGTMVLANND